MAKMVILELLDSPKLISALKCKLRFCDIFRFQGKKNAKLKPLKIGEAAAPRASLLAPPLTVRRGRLAIWTCTAQEIALLYVMLWKLLFKKLPLLTVMRSFSYSL